MSAARIFKFEYHSSHSRPRIRTSRKFERLFTPRYAADLDGFWHNKGEAFETLRGWAYGGKYFPQEISFLRFASRRYNRVLSKYTSRLRRYFVPPSPPPKGSIVPMYRQVLHTLSPSVLFFSAPKIAREYFNIGSAPPSPPATWRWHVFCIREGDRNEFRARPTNNEWKWRHLAAPIFTGQNFTQKLHRVSHNNR